MNLVIAGLILLISLPTILCVLVLVLNKAATKLERSNNLGDTISSYSEFSNSDVKVESMMKLPDRSDMRMFLREFGGDIYGDYDIRSNDLLYSGFDDMFEDQIPEDLPEVDVPLFKPKD